MFELDFKYSNEFIKDDKLVDELNKLKDKCPLQKDEIDKLTNDCAKTGVVLELIVRNSIRGNGIGQALLEKMEENKNSINEIDPIKVGQRLKEFHKENKITQVKLANMLNTVQPVIANYEKGKYLISIPFLYTICKKYNISADYLLGKIDNPKYLKWINT